MSKYNTRQRKVLLDYLMCHKDMQISAKMIAEALKDENISISAVYRNLAALETDGKIKRHTKDGSREVYYRFVDDDDCRSCLHLSCKECGKTYHMQTNDANMLIERIAQTENFEIDRAKTVIYGMCVDCKHNKEKV